MTIVRNLLDNAIKYSLTGGTISLKAQTSTAGVSLKVEDSGIGMTPEKIKDIFLLSENKSEKGTQGEKGTGLGLHLINELVKLNKGAINVNSRKGEGTVFNVVLPVG